MSLLDDIEHQTNQLDTLLPDEDDEFLDSLVDGDDGDDGDDDDDGQQLQEDGDDNGLGHFEAPSEPEATDTELADTELEPTPEPAATLESVADELLLAETPVSEPTPEPTADQDIAAPTSAVNDEKKDEQPPTQPTEPTEAYVHPLLLSPPVEPEAAAPTPATTTTTSTSTTTSAAAKSSQKKKKKPAKSNDDDTGMGIFGGGNMDARCEEFFYLVCVKCIKTIAGMHAPNLNDDINKRHTQAATSIKISMAIQNPQFSDGVFRINIKSLHDQAIQADVPFHEVCMRMVG
jgi:hypothetical protein